MGCKAEETTHNNNAFGLGSTNGRTVQWWFKKFWKWDKSLEDEEHSGRPWEADNDQLRGSLKLLQLRKKLSKNSTSTIIWSFSIWSKLERWNSSISGCLMSWPPKIITVLKCSLLLFYATTMKHFLIGLWQVTKSGFYTKTGNNQLIRWTETKLQSQTCTEERSWSLLGGLLPVWSTTAFWIPVKPLELRSMFSKLMRGTENCNACSQYWSTEWA